MTLVLEVTAAKEQIMTTFDEIAERYIAVWNETDAEARRGAIDALYSERARYTDPMVDAEGREAIDQTIAAVQSQFPGFVFRLAGDVDAHHNQARFTWELGPAGGEAPIVGFDVAVIDDDGRLETVLGFLDRVPTA
jgi:SnoaL-like domain